MDKELENNDWMNEAPFLAGLPKVNPFSTPDGYFENLDDRIAGAIYFEGLKQEAGKMELSVPEGYFEGFKEDIYTRIAVEGLKEKAGTDGFTVPEGYFEQLQRNINRQLPSEQKVSKERPVVKLWYTGMMKYAVAACVVIISAVGLYYQNQTNVAATPAATVQVTQVSAEDQALFDMDEQEIIDQIPAKGTGQVTNTTATESEIEDYILTHYTQNEIAANY
jgi:hypothetical protein